MYIWYYIKFIRTRRASKNQISLEFIQLLRELMVPQTKLRSYNYHIIWNSLGIMFIMLFYGGSVMMQPKWIVSILHFVCCWHATLKRWCGFIQWRIDILREFCGDEHTNLHSNKYDLAANIYIKGTRTIKKTILSLLRHKLVLKIK